MSKSKEVLSPLSESTNDIIKWTKKSLSILEKETRINFFKKAWERLKHILGIDKKNEEKKVHTVESFQQWWNTISEEMFQQLLKMEWSQNFVAQTHKWKFWETFVTGPYWMVYKHIDWEWNLLEKPIPFKNWECVSQKWAEKNARAYYNKKAAEWKGLLDSKWYIYSQDMLDSLVSASWGTKRSVDRLKNFVLSHRDDKNAIYEFMSKFATTAAWNWKVMPGLVTRRKFEANWFQWNKHPYSDFQKGYYA